MPGNVLAYVTQMGVTIDSTKPDAMVTKENVRLAGKCPDCPALKHGRSLPVFISEGSRRSAIALCSDVEQLTALRIGRACRENHNKACGAHGATATIGTETLPLNVFSKDVVDDAFAHRQ